jgi:cytochrome d ubiquinol oxidase subunit II
MSWELLLAGMLLMSLVLYVLTGGADYGAGVWTLLARGRAHRAVIDKAIAPIWEANHVWLILVVTILFAGFSPAYALITTTLHVPLTALLVAIVLRGSAFAFRTNDARHRSELDPSQAFWTWVFAGSSVVAPLMLGITIGAIASGHLALRSPTFFDTFVAPWLAAFPLLVGCFALALFVYLAAIYLIFETDDLALQEDFRRRAVACWIVVSIIGVIVLYLSRRGAPEVYAGLARTTLGVAVVGATAAAGLISLSGLLLRLFRLARAGAVAQVTLIVFGWAGSQYPYVVAGDLTLEEAASPDVTLRLLTWSLVLGGVVLFPSLYYLYRIFKPHAFVSLLADSPPADIKASCPTLDILSSRKPITEQDQREK